MAAGLEAASVAAALAAVDMAVVDIAKKFVESGACVLRQYQAGLFPPVR
jgi:hypothetical protein